MKCRNTPEKFWSKVNICGADKCWFWLASKDKDGYGYFRYNGKNDKAHRVSWIIINGPIPDGLCVLHKCDNPGCVNYNHLFIGTTKDNVVDMFNKGRANKVKGEKHGGSKLTEAQVIQIREDSRTHEKIAKTYNVYRTVITKIKNRQIWKHV